VYQENRCLEIAIYLSLTNHKALNACPPISNSLFVIPLIDKALSKPIKPTLPPHPTHKHQPQAQNFPQRQPICPYPHKYHLLHCQPYNPTRAQPTQLTHTNLLHQQPTHTMATPKPTTCCGRSGESCVCASKATCSCGQRSAMDCNCEKAATENKVVGARCSCREFPTSSYAFCCLLYGGDGIRRLMHR